MLEQPPLPQGIRLLTNNELAHLRSKIPTLPASPLDCPTCYGKGTYRWWDESTPREPADWACNCIDQWTMFLYLLHSGIGDNYQRLGWADLRAEDGAIETAERYIMRAEAYVRSGFGLTFHGNHGTGKTLLSTLILKHLLGLGYDCYFTTFSEMIDTYTGGWHDAEERRRFHQRIKNARVLVIDDVGKEYQGRNQTGLPGSTFDEVLRHRVAAATPTIITTNHDLDTIHQKYGTGLGSLIQERNRSYEFTGQNFRPQFYVRQDNEVDLGLRRPVTLV